MYEFPATQKLDRGVPVRRHGYDYTWVTRKKTAHIKMNVWMSGLHISITYPGVMRVDYPRATVLHCGVLKANFRIHKSNNYRSWTTKNLLKYPHFARLVVFC